MNNLGRKIASGAFWVTVGSVAQQAINFGMFIYLAQALEPVTFGVMALAMVFIEILMVAGRLGQTDWLLHKEELTDEVASTSFWLLGLSGAAIALFVAFIAPLVAEGFEEPEVLGVMLALAPMCFLGNLGAVSEARLRRDYKFRAIALRVTIASIASAGAALIAMALNAGLYALVAQKFVMQVGLAAITIAMDGWRPKLFFSFSMARDLAVNGFRTAAGIFSHQVAPRVVDGIVGGALGAAALGYLRIAWQLSYFVLHLFINPVVNVSTTTFGRIKDDPTLMSDTFRGMVQGVLLFLAPTALGLMAIAPILIPALIGDKWEPSVVVIQITTLTFFTEIPCYLLLGVLIGLGRSRQMVYYGLILLGLSAIAAVITAPYGVEAVAAGYAVRCVLCAVVAFWMLNAIFPLQREKFLRAVVPPTLAAAAMAGVVFWASGQLPAWGIEDRTLQLVALIPIGAVAYVGFLGLGDVARLWRGFTKETLVSVKRLVARG